MYEPRWNEPMQRLQETMLEIKKYLKPTTWGLKYHEKAMVYMVYSKTYGVWIDYPVTDVDIGKTRIVKYICGE